MAPHELKQAYRIAREAMQQDPDALRGRQGHRIFWMHAGAGRPSGAAVLPSHPAWDAVAVVGTHSRCDIVLPDDRSAALRHLLVRSIGMPTGGLAMRIFDLHTAGGFVLTDGSQQTSIFAEGPIAIGVGEHALVALPERAGRDASGRAHDGLPPELPPAELSTPPHVRERIAALEEAMSPYRANARPMGMSRITLMPQLVMMGERRVPELAALAPERRWTITLERGGRSAMESVSDLDLAGGVLIGRSEKCLSEELRRITDNNTSRVHVLIVLEGEHVSAYDLASTRGVFHNGARARRIALGSSATFLLGGSRDPVRVTWQRAS